MSGNALIDELTSARLAFSNPLADITEDCVIVHDSEHAAHFVLGIETITGLKKLTFTNPGLLVISCGLFTIAAGSYASKQGLEISGVIAAIGSLFVLAYFGTRRAAIMFLMNNESVESIKGSYRQANAVIRALQRLRQPMEAPAAVAG